MDTGIDIITAALYDAAACYRNGYPDRAAEHAKRAENAMYRYDVTPELVGQVRVVVAYTAPFDTARAADVCDRIAQTTERVYA